MPLRDHLKSLKSEFNNIKHELKQFQGQGQGQNQSQSHSYPGQAQQQGYGGSLPHQSGQHGGQYGIQYQPSQQYGQQTYGALPAHTQNYQSLPPNSQPQQYGGAPPIPYNSHPNSGQQPKPQNTYVSLQHPHPSNLTTYWTPSFHPQTPVSSNFTHKLGNNNGWGNAELQTYTSSPSNSYHTQNNKLVIRAISQPNHPDPSQRYTSARLVSHQKLSNAQGCITAVLSMPSARGIWPAFWLLPSEPFHWPSDGEVDMAESWNGENINHACLHWGHFTLEDAQKHRVITTPLPDLDKRAVRYEFCWMQNEHSPRKEGRLLWVVDGNAVMKAEIPVGMRLLRDWNILLNIAMGGNVCGGKTPEEGSWEMIVHELRMSAEPDGDGGDLRRDGGGQGKGIGCEL